MLCVNGGNYIRKQFLSTKGTNGYKEGLTSSSLFAESSFFITFLSYIIHNSRPSYLIHYFPFPSFSCLSIHFSFPIFIWASSLEINFLFYPNIMSVSFSSLSSLSIIHKSRHDYAEFFLANH